MTIVEIQPRTVRAHEVFGDFWFNSEPVIVSALRGRVILVEFWDFTCVNCMRALPYVKEWHRRYEQHDLVVIGVHTPKFPFGKNPETIQRAIEQLGITFPVVMDNGGLIAANYGQRAWPSVYIIDRHGYIRFQTSGEGNYATTERVLQTLLYESGVAEDLPLLMEPIHEEDRAGAVCFRSSPELFAGYLKGSIGNVEGFSPESIVDYNDPALYVDDRIYAVGSWLNGRNSLQHQEGESGEIVLSYHAREVNAVINPEGEQSIEVAVLQDEQFLTEENRGDDIRVDAAGRSYFVVSEPRLYSLVKNQQYGEHIVKLQTTSPGFSLYSFSFVSSVIPEVISSN
ncbi:MAG: redoxin domain-containing protein [Ignavibacteriae bacterium]|nr:redoxin domain-containing protein [Ignavibacteriota bacterium]